MQTVYPSFNLTVAVLEVDVDPDRLRDAVAIIRMHGFELDETSGQRAIGENLGQPARTFAAAGTLVDLIENFYEEPVEKVARRARALMDQHSSWDTASEYLRPGDFLEMHESTWAMARPTPPARSEAELRPFFGKGRPISFNYADAGSIAPETTGQDLLGTAIPKADTKEVKALLLYAHSIVVSDPFVSKDSLHFSAFELMDLGWHPQMAYGGTGQSIRSSVSLDSRINDFTDALELISNLAPLIRNGVAFVLPPPNSEEFYFGDPDEAMKCIVSKLWPRRYVSRLPRDLLGLATIVHRRAVDQMREVLRFGGSISTFASGKFDEVGLDSHPRDDQARRN